MLVAGLAMGLLVGYLAWGRRPASGVTSNTPPSGAVATPPPARQLPSANAGPTPPDVPGRQVGTEGATSTTPAKASSPAGTAMPQRRAATPAASSVDGRPREHAAPRPAAKGPARVEFVSRPAGARVFVDGRALGTTPLTVETIAPGRRAVRFQLDGYRPWATTVDLSPGQRRRLAASLELTAASQGPR
jgi:hypothetical protein